MSMLLSNCWALANSVGTASYLQNHVVDVLRDIECELNVGELTCITLLLSFSTIDLYKLHSSSVKKLSIRNTGGDL